MKPASFAIRCSAVLCGALLHTLPLAAAAVDFAAMPAARLTLLPDRYVLDGREYYDAHAVEAALDANRVKAVRIDNCAPAWTPQLLGTVARLHVYVLDLRLLDADASACRVAALTPAMLSSAPAEAGLSPEQVARYWRNLEP